MFKTDATRVRRVSQFEVFFVGLKIYFHRGVHQRHAGTPEDWESLFECWMVTLDLSDQLCHYSLSTHNPTSHNTNSLTTNGQSWVEFGMGVRVRAREREVRVFSDTILLHSASHLEKTLSSSSFRRVPQKEEMHCFCLGRTRGRRGEAETGRHPSIIEQGLKKGEYLCPPWSLIPLSWKPCVPASVTQHCT